MHRHNPAAEAPPHRCVLPALHSTHEGDLWRCKCRRLWQVQAYPGLGQVSYRWVRPRLSVRVLFHPLVPDTEWQWALFGIGMVALTAFTAKLGGYLGWWS